MANMLLDRRRRSVSALTGSVGGYRPEVDLSFARERYSVDADSVDLSGAVTFARSGTATYIDANGTLQTAADGVARAGSHVWDGSAWVASGLRFESKAFTNLNTYTTASAANWPAGSSTVADISENALGVFPGITVTSNGATFHRASIQQFAASSGTTYAGAVLFKYGTSNGFTLRLRNVTGGVESQINSVAQVVSVGTVLAGAVNDVKVTNAGPDGLKLLTFTLDANFTGDLLVGFGPNTATAGLNVKAFALQIGAGTEAGSWVLTSGTTATRNAETMVIPSANTPDLSGGFTVAMDGYLNYTDNNSGTEVIPWELYDTATARARVRLFTDAGTGGMSVQMNNGAWSDVQSDASAFAPGVAVPFSIASRHADNDMNMAVGGTALTANTSCGLVPDLSSVDVDLGIPFMGHIKSIRIFGTGLSDDLLELATT